MVQPVRNRSSSKRDEQCADGDKGHNYACAQTGRLRGVTFTCFQSFDFSEWHLGGHAIRLIADDVRIGYGRDVKAISRSTPAVHYNIVALFNGLLNRLWRRAPHGLYRSTTHKSDRREDGDKGSKHGYLF